jgi:DNA-binding XRE family transcriptional regulator
LKALKKDMRWLGYKNKDLAKVLGVSKTTVGKWLKGEFLPSTEQIKALKKLKFSETACLAPSKEVEV